MPTNPATVQDLIDALTQIENKSLPVMFEGHEGFEPVFTCRVAQSQLRCDNRVEVLLFGQRQHFST